MNEAVYQEQEVTIGGWRFRALARGDRSFVNGQLSQSSCPSCNWYNDFSFFWLFDRARSARRVLWRSVEDLVVPFVVNERRRKAYLLRPPFGSGTPDQYVSALYTGLAMCHGYNRQEAKAAFCRSVDEGELRFMKQSPLFDDYFTLKRRKGVEHHYDVSAICDLSGSRFSYIRRKLSKFSRRYPNCLIRPYTNNDRKQMARLFDLWLDDARTAQDRERKRQEERYFLASLEYASPPEHMILVAEVDDTIVGMISGGIRAAGDAWCFQRKTLHAYDGLAETLVVELARAIRQQDPNVGFLNDGSDLDDPGLRYFKQHFHPTRTLSRYRLYAKF